MHYLSQSLIEHYADSSQAALDLYSSRALARIWKAERFSWWMTSLMHRFEGQNSFEHRMKAAELAYLEGSHAAQTALAENYVGLPLD